MPGDFLGWEVAMQAILECINNIENTCTLQCANDNIYVYVCNIL